MKYFEKTAKDEDYTWAEGQEAVSRALRGNSDNFFAAAPGLRKKILKKQNEKAKQYGVYSSLAGAALGALFHKKILRGTRLDHFPQKAQRIISSVGTALPVGYIGSAMGMNVGATKAKKDFLKEKGIKTKFLDLGKPELTEKAQKKYLKKDAAINPGKAWKATKSYAPYVGVGGLYGSVVGHQIGKDISGDNKKSKASTTGAILGGIGGAAFGAYGKRVFDQTMRDFSKNRKSRSSGSYWGRSRPSTGQSKKYFEGMKGVSTKKDAQKQYRNWAKKHHPDKFSQASESKLKKQKEIFQEGQSHWENLKGSEWFEKLSWLLTQYRLGRR